jgi:hypothetical protein
VEIANSLVVPAAGPQLPLSFAALRDFLLKMIEAHETNGPTPTPPLGWRLNRSAWNAVTRFTFLEYDFFYAFNDFSRYQDALFANEHEGDNEGCCLVFDRSLFTFSPNDANALLRVYPHSMMTSVHEEFQDADKFKSVDPPVSFPPELRARDVVPFTFSSPAVVMPPTSPAGRTTWWTFRITWRRLKIICSAPLSWRQSLYPC